MGARVRGLGPDAIVALVILIVFIVVTGALNVANDAQRIGTLIVGATAAVVMARRSAERESKHEVAKLHETQRLEAEHERLKHELKQ